MGRPAVKRRRTASFPWLLLLVLIGTIYLFWVLPYQQGPSPIQVEWETSPPKTSP